jgi:hypothetical protein
MKIFIALLLAISINFSLKAQIKSETEYSEIYRTQVYTASNYNDLIDYLITNISFKFVRKLKDLSIRDIKGAIINMGSAAITQMNIDGQYNCVKRHEDIFNLWNLYYPKITMETWDNICKGAIPLMELDGVLITR